MSSAFLVLEETFSLGTEALESRRLTIELASSSNYESYI
jgi:hypothetical protein